MARGSLGVLEIKPSVLEGLAASRWWSSSIVLHLTWAESMMVPVNPLPPVDPSPLGVPGPGLEEPFCPWGGKKNQLEAENGPRVCKPRGSSQRLESMVRVTPTHRAQGTSLSL